MICRSHPRASGQMTATQLPRPPSPGRLDTPVLGEAARHRSPQRALTLQLGVVLRLGQKEPGQRGQEQQGPHSRVWVRSACTRLNLNWKLRDWAGGRCHALGPPQGRCRALLRPLRGRVFSLRRSGPPDKGQVIVVPGSCRLPIQALPTLSPRDATLPTGRNGLGG